MRLRLTQDLTERVVRAIPHARRILLGPAQYVQFATEQASLRRFVEATPGALGEWRFMGLPVVLDLPHEFCVNCGAPSEPDVCNYCKTQATTITVVPRETI